MPMYQHGWSLSEEQLFKINEHLISEKCPTSYLVVSWKEWHIVSLTHVSLLFVPSCGKAVLHFRIKCSMIVDASLLCRYLQIFILRLHWSRVMLSLSCQRTSSFNADPNTSLITVLWYFFKELHVSPSIFTSSVYGLTLWTSLEFS